MEDLYLTVDISLLTYVFETFRKESVDSLKLERHHYISTPGYS